jgi:hypothetical protein
MGRCSERNSISSPGLKEIFPPSTAFAPVVLSFGSKLRLFPDKIVVLTPFVFFLNSITL